jgi:hypothetical protein
VLSEIANNLLWKTPHAVRPVIPVTVLWALWFCNQFTSCSISVGFVGVTTTFTSLTLFNTVSFWSQFAEFEEFISFPFRYFACWTVDTLFEHLHHYSPIATVGDWILWHVTDVWELCAFFTFHFQWKAVLSKLALSALKLEAAISTFSWKICCYFRRQRRRSWQLTGIELNVACVKHVLSHFIQGKPQTFLSLWKPISIGWTTVLTICADDKNGQANQ